MSSGVVRAECRKFTPNIFNKTKCTNCFRQKDEHTAEALECNRAARKISKCGYLFVAPGWDFSVPVNRTKRWQRRWFVLYDDGELSYSLDEHPNTIPQASIDMTKVMEVSDAEEVTGNSYSIAITASDGVHFVKGTCREEVKWWKDVLSVFLRSKGRHKRNATFPVSQTPSILQQTSINCRSSSESRPRFNSVRTDSDIVLHAKSPKWLGVEDDIYPTRDTTISIDSFDSPGKNDIKKDCTSNSASENEKLFRDHHHPVTSFSPPTRDKVNPEERVKTRRNFNREKHGFKFEKEIYCEGKGNEIFGELSSIKGNLNMEQNVVREGTSAKNEQTRRLLLETEKCKRKEKLKDIVDSLTKPRLRKNIQRDYGSVEFRSLNHLKPTRDGECSDEEKESNVLTSSASSLAVSEIEADREKSVRGDPDGCGLDLTLHGYSPDAELRVNLPAEDLLNIKKGWLLKQGNGQVWTKHWFVLRGVALMYYRDQTAEDKGILDGVMDLSSLKNVSELQVQRNYGFQAVSWDDRRYILSAATAGIRSNWITAILKAAGLLKKFNSSSLEPNEKLEHDAEKTRFQKNSSFIESNHSTSHNSNLNSGSQRTEGDHLTDSSCLDKFGSSHLPVTISSSTSCQYVEKLLRQPGAIHFSDKGELQLKKSSSAQSLLSELYKGQSEAGLKVLESNNKVDWKNGPAHLPPSPPLNRTPISKVKERAKTQTTRSRVYNKRSKSSPPSSRKNSLSYATYGEGLSEGKREVHSKRTSLLDKVDKHVKEIDELKGQLTFALCERSSAEKELSRLRQRKSEANQQVEELLRSLKIAESELKQKTQELENFESLKQRYSALVKEHEDMLKSWRDSAISDGWREMYQQLKEEYTSDKETWEVKLESVSSMFRVATERCEMLTRELTSSEDTVQSLKAELTNLSERLMRGLEENEGLYGRMRELEGRCLSSSRERGRSVDSLSDLTNVDLEINLDTLNRERIIEEYEELKGRFEKAIQEIRAMKKELRESHANYDDLELTVINLRQDSKRKEENGKAQAELMASRIEDLTLKLSASEKQSRILKQKISKSESREKRRSLSLKGKESFYIGKETEEKLAELEAKVEALESGKQTSIVIKTASPSFDKKNREEFKSTRCRRKSLDSSISSEPMKILVRLVSLERKINKASEDLGKSPKNSQLEVTKFTYQKEIVSKISKKLQECKAIIHSIKSNNQISTCKSFSSLEKYLEEMENLLANSVSFTPTLQGDKLIFLGEYEDYIAQLLENLLKSKIIELSNKKRELSEKNELNKETILLLMAEKLAYESVLIKKILGVLSESSLLDENWRQSLDMLEIHEIKALMILIVKKIEGENVNLLGTALDSLSKIISETLYLEGEVISGNLEVLKNLIEKYDQRVDYQTLIEHEKGVSELVNVYKIRKLNEIACSLAYDRANVSSKIENYVKHFKEDKGVQKACSLARETLNKELALAEVSQSALRYLLINKNEEAPEQKGKLAFLAEKHKRLEEYLQKVEESFCRVIDSTVVELANAYEKNLKVVKKENVVKKRENLDEKGNNCGKLMEDLFCLVAQMTIVNTKILFLTKDSTEIGDKSQDLSVPKIKIPLMSEPDELDFETRFIYMYEKFSAECMQLTENFLPSSKNLATLMTNLSCCLEQVNRLREMLHLPKSSATINPSQSNCKGIFDQCIHLSAQLEDTVNNLNAKSLCKECCFLKEALFNAESHYEEEIRILKVSHENELKDLQGELESQKNSLVCQHKQEQAQLVERTKRLEKRLETLDAEYSQQIDNLRMAYHKPISTEFENKGEHTEDSIRLRYQAEIEQLRILCEKGLSAVDNSHRRIIMELEAKHKQELAAAAAEKEQALAEETQATLAALDAMRKAHESEVQKEITKFKTEFLKKMQSNRDIGTLHKEHEAEMEEIRKEILSLSEKYSVKCVESASLEEQLSYMSKELNQAQEHIVQLDARNKQLCAHLISGSSDIDNFNDFQNESGKSLLVPTCITENAK